MKQLFLDTNIILDLLAKRDPFYDDAAVLFSLADKKIVELFVSSLTFANTNYILLKQLKPEEAKRVLRKLKVLVNVLSLDDKIIELALNDKDFKDYENALQYYTAIENGNDVIITRNKKDFHKAKLPIITAGEFIKLLK